MMMFIEGMFVLTILAPLMICIWGGAYLVLKKIIKG